MGLFTLCAVKGFFAKVEADDKEDEEGAAAGDLPGAEVARVDLPPQASARETPALATAIVELSPSSRAPLAGLGIGGLLFI
jgi:hypothetical protein